MRQSKYVLVLDTNIIVSALLSANSKPYLILQPVLSGENVIVYDNRIIEEYNAVLHYKKFKFKESDISDVLNLILRDGILVNAPSIDIPFKDPDDLKFYEVAKATGALLITGNIKDYPNEEIIMTPADFYHFLQ